MGIHAEDVSLVGWYQDDAYRLMGERKVVAAESFIFFFLLLRSRCSSQPLSSGGSGCTWLPALPPTPPRGKEQVLMRVETQAGRVFRCCVF